MHVFVYFFHLVPTFTPITAGGHTLKKVRRAPTKLVGCFGRPAKKVPRTRGFFFADKSSDFGSTSSRGCLIYPLCITLCTVRMYLHAIVTLSFHRLLGSSLPLPSAMVAQSVSAKLGLGQNS